MRNTRSDHGRQGQCSNHLRFYDEQVGVPHDLGGGNLSQI